MSFINAIVAKSPDIVLAEYTTYQGNFSQVSRLILQKIQPNTIGVIKSGIKKFFFVCEEKIIYLCLVEEMPEETAFGFLHDLKTQVLESKYSYEALMRMNAYELKSIETDIADLMDYFNIHPVTTRAGQPIEDFRNITNIVSENINKFLNKEIVLTVHLNKDNEPIAYGKTLNTLVCYLI